jgi:hypothetical protein
MNIMKAAVYFQPGKPDVLHYRDVPLPVCGPDDVLVKIEAIALEGGDVINRATAAPGRGDGSRLFGGGQYRCRWRKRERSPSRPTGRDHCPCRLSCGISRGPCRVVLGSRKGWMWLPLRLSRSVLVRLRERCFRA